MSKYRTWKDECLPRMVLRNQTGDIALCVLWNQLDSVLATLPSPEDFPRLSAVGNLRTPLGISWFLRGLGQLPNITTVVIWGSDLTGTGDALFSLWEQGPTEGHCIPSAGWRLDPLVNREAVDQLRQEVDLIDVRNLSLTTVGAVLPKLRQVRNSRQPLEFPPVEIPERSVLPHQGAIQLVAPNPSTAWLDILGVLSRTAQERTTRKGERIIHLFDLFVTMPVPEIETIRPPFDFSPADFARYYGDFISTDPPPPGIDYRYGHRMQAWRNHNQLEEVIARLQKSPGTKRATIVLLDPTDLAELKDAPCVALGTFCVQDGVLNTSWVIRSNDMYGGWPFNVLALLRVHRHAAKRLAVGLGTIDVLSQNAQIYEESLPLTAEKVKTWGLKIEDFGPGHLFSPDSAGNFIFAVEDSQVRMTMTNPEGDQVLMELSHLDPVALISWAVETMPWLAHQHIRYLGAEQEKLRRALKTGEPYIQG